jgi:hypothetical protein
MKVLRPGRGRTKVQWACTGCDALIESTQDEGRGVSDQRDGDAVVFICPECGKENWIDVRQFNNRRQR